MVLKKKSLKIQKVWSEVESHSLTDNTMSKRKKVIVWQTIQCLKGKKDQRTSNEQQSTMQKTRDWAARNRVPRKGNSSGSNCTGGSCRVTLTTINMVISFCFALWGKIIHLFLWSMHLRHSCMICIYCQRS
jgi:hypothetical protein